MAIRCFFFKCSAIKKGKIDLRLGNKEERERGAKKGLWENKNINSSMHLPERKDDHLLIFLSA